jgi:regulator of sirC expression with transglutaminase-like and TPR domain
MKSRKGNILELLDDPDPPVERAALLIARDAYPQLDLSAEKLRLDLLAAPLAAGIASAHTPTLQANALAAHLYDELGFHGNEGDYHDPRNSYLNDVVARRIGLPITLAVLLCAVGRRVGVQVDGIGFPGHFLARVGGERGVYVDPFRGGRILDERAQSELARSVLGEGRPLSAEHLAPSSTLAIAVRMLLNLKHAHERRGDHAAALVVTDRLVDLGGSAEHRRDRGKHALALGAHRAAASDLERYLAERPAARDAAEVHALLAQAKRSVTKSGAAS